MEVDSFDPSDSSTRLQTRSMSIESARSESSNQPDPPRIKAKAKRRSKAERDQISKLNPNLSGVLDEDEDEEESGKLYFHIVE